MRLPRLRAPLPGLTRRLHRVPKQLPGAPPEQITAAHGALPTSVRVTRYDAGRFEPTRDATPDELRAFEDEPGVTWVEVTGLGSLDTLRAVAAAVSMPPLTLADVVHVPQRSRFEEQDEGWFVVARMDQPGEGFRLRQVALWVRGSVVVLFLEEPTELFEPVRERLTVDDSRLRRSGPDYFVYRLCDAAVDSFFPTLEQTTARLEDVESAVLESPTATPLRELYRTRREFRRIHRAAVGVRDAVQNMAREGDGLFVDATRPYLWDVHDHAAQIVELAEHGTSIATDVGTLVENSINQRMNHTMRTLTIVATIFIPLGFVAGLYGMNFDTESPYNMPELSWKYGYPAVLCGMAAIAGLMFLWFRLQGWMRDED